MEGSVLFSRCFNFGSSSHGISPNLLQVDHAMGESGGVSDDEIIESDIELDEACLEPDNDPPQQVDFCETGMLSLQFFLL